MQESITAKVRFEVKFGGEVMLPVCHGKQFQDSQGAIRLYDLADIVVSAFPADQREGNYAGNSTEDVLLSLCIDICWSVSSCWEHSLHSGIW